VVEGAPFRSRATASQCLPVSRLSTQTLSTTLVRELQKNWTSWSWSVRGSQHGPNSCLDSQSPHRGLGRQEHVQVPKTVKFLKVHHVCSGLQASYGRRVCGSSSFKLQVWKRKPSFGLNSSGDLTPAPSSFLLRGRHCSPSVLFPKSHLLFYPSSDTVVSSGHPLADHSDTALSNTSTASGHSRSTS